MRVLLFVLYYLIALVVGFSLRSVYDRWMYQKPHMQARLRVFSQELVMYDPAEDGDDEMFCPPGTLDAFAINPQGALQACEDREKELQEIIEQRLGQGGEEEPGAETAGGDDFPEEEQLPPEGQPLPVAQPVLAPQQPPLDSQSVPVLESVPAVESVPASQPPPVPQPPLAPEHPLAPQPPVSEPLSVQVEPASSDLDPLAGPVGGGRTAAPPSSGPGTEA